MRVVIVGGGPSGAFCAIRLLRDGGREPPEVVILDRKIYCTHGPRGCNLCAGVISGSLVDQLNNVGLTIPPQVIQREIRGYHLVSRREAVHLQRGAGRIYTAYRTLGPPDSAYSEERSFDHFLLQHAVRLGAQHLRELATTLEPLPAGKGWRVEYGEGNSIDADVVVVACGVHSSLPGKLSALGFGYSPPQTIHACQAEIPLEADAVTEYFDDEIKVFALRLPGIKFAAIIPKEQHVTVTLAGPQVKRKDLEEFLGLPQVRAHFPAQWRLPSDFCHCHPKIPVGAGRPGAGNRLLIVGDAHVSRYLKNGLVSAFHTGSFAAEAILQTGGESPAMGRAYVESCERLFGLDNLVGRLLFKAHETISASPRLSDALIRANRKEQDRAGAGSGATTNTVDHAAPATRVLWNMFTGDLPYMDTLKAILTPRFALSITKGMFGRRERKNIPATDEF